MAAYGVIGGAIGGAIAVALGGWLSKRLLERQEKRQKKKKKDDVPVSFRPGASWFGFLVGVGGMLFGIFGLYYFKLFRALYLIITGEVEITLKLIGASLMVYGTLIFLTVFGILWSCWTGAFLGARITISKERLVIDHAVKLNKKYKHMHLWQFGCHHLDVRWEEIHELKANINQMNIILKNGECYMFPIGWCLEKARAAVRRHKQILPLE